MSLISPSKILFVVGSILSCLMSLLPEFIPDELKKALQNKFGDKYMLVWITIFVVLSIVLLLIAWYQNKSGSSSLNSVKITGNRNKSIQTIGNTPKSNEAVVQGDNNENEQK